MLADIALILLVLSSETGFEVWRLRGGKERFYFRIFVRYPFLCFLPLSYASHHLGLPQLLSLFIPFIVVEAISLIVARIICRKKGWIVDSQIR